MTTELQRVDYSVLQVNQFFIITLNALAFILYQPWIAAFVMLVMVLGTLLK
jgi:hypothetical protein